MENISEEAKTEDVKKISFFRRALRFLTGLFVWSFLTLLILIICFTLWIYTGNRSIPYVAEYTAKTISNVLPETSNLKIKDVLVTIQGHDILLKVINPVIKDDIRGDFELSEVDLRLDVVGFFPQSNRNILSIEISDPRLQLNKLLNVQDNESNDDKKLPIEQINTYLNEHKNQLTKFSLSLNNTKFAFNITDTETIEVVINNLTLAPNIQEDKVVLSLFGDINISGNPNIIDLTIDTSQVKHLEFHGGITNISTLLFESLGFPLKELSGSNLEVDINFSGKTSSLRNLEFAKFDISNLRGKITKNDYFLSDIKPTSLVAKGEIHDNGKIIKVEDLELKVGDSNLKGRAELKNGKLLSSLKIPDIKVDDLSKYWATNLISRTRAWIFDSVLDGRIKNADISLKLDLTAAGLSKSLSKDAYKVSFDIEKAVLKLDKKMPTITGIDTSLSIDSEKVVLKGKTASVQNVKMINFNGTLDRLGFSDSTLVLDGDVIGKTKDIANLAFSFSSEKSDIFSDVIGDTNAKLKMKLRIFDDIKSVKDLNMKVSADIKGFGSDKLIPNFPVSNGALKANYTDGVISFEGVSTVKNLDNIKVSGAINILDNSKKVSVSKNIDAKKLDEFGVTVSNYFNNNLEVLILAEQKAGSDNLDISAKAVFDESNLNIPQISISGAEGKKGYISIFASKAKDSVEIKSFDIKTSQIDGAGVLKFNEKNELTSLASRKIKFGKSEFSFKYLKEPLIKIDIVGPSFDYSVLNITPAKSTSSQKISSDTKKENADGLFNIPDSDINIKVDKLYLKGNELIYKPQIEFKSKNKKIEKLILNGFIEGAPLKIEYISPRLVVNTPNAGNIFRGLGIYDNISGGKMFASGLLEGDVFNGDLVINDFRVQKAPVLAKILSVASVTLTSFNSLETIIGGKGVKFDKLVSKFQINNGNILIDDFLVKGPSLALTGLGYVDLYSDSIKLDGTVVPENLLNKAVKNIPVINKFLGIDEKGEEAIGVNYSVRGKLTKPEVKVDPLSILAPGILKKILGK